MTRFHYHFAEETQKLQCAQYQRTEAEVILGRGGAIGSNGS
jgi:hypothetical protein